MKVNSVKYSNTWFAISTLLVVASLFFMVLSMIKLGTPLRLGLDFTGGTKIEYRLPELGAKNIKINSNDVVELLNKIGLAGSTASVTKDENPLLIIKTKALSESEEIENLNKQIKEKYGAYEIASIDTVSPTIGPELFQNGLVALLLTVIGIILYISNRFKRDFAISAILALFHDVIILMGLFAYLGLYKGIEIDTLFITAVLTTFGFSVHDTIVVFDRIRENQKLQSKNFSFADLADHSVNQVCVRSLNTSLTVLTTLACLFLFGGASTQNFVGALFIGLAVGTYSSIFIATPLLVKMRK
jgi:preprotein translocase subunit SecF